MTLEAHDGRNPPVTGLLWVDVFNPEYPDIHCVVQSSTPGVDTDGTPTRTVVARWYPRNQVTVWPIVSNGWETAGGAITLRQGQGWYAGSPPVYMLTVMVNGRLAINDFSNDFAMTYGYVDFATANPGTSCDWPS